MPSQQQSYTCVARWLHWLMAVIILVSAAIGLYGALCLSYGVSAEQTAWKAQVITVHKSLATTVLFLIVLRILWRLTHRPPALLGMSVHMVQAAHLGHLLLYVLMVLDPITGWANSSASGHPIAVLGLFPLPPLLSKSPLLVPTISLVHELISYGLLIVIAGHVFFALRHKFVDKDGTLEAMLPGWAKK